MRFPIILFTLITSTLAASQEAQVYLLPPNPIQHHEAPALNPTEANALISHHLGLDVYEALPDQIEGWWHKVTGWVYGNVVTNGVGQGPQDAVLIVIQSNHPEGWHLTPSVPTTPANEGYPVPMNRLHSVRHEAVVYHS